ncbi:hypothetical protein JD974_12500 [Chromobacterium haemolyticum]|uniref:Uncharacterized protein n=1 Tax=Chromobacterium haemolyticum TaxID=394935 RepID=A0ABS3GNP8_9NEIS|nr:hypothetical protein [Chromobacterium haemolyticum]MBK0415226.1 hypothetical protein [Chromobacterium haemolyticum]MBO0416559.1 hypothetical protein [Chromobacterium haemolyticum]MBO0499865.1 hypothetical protein [Chromobacterium haemolyticum]
MKFIDLIRFFSNGKFSQSCPVCNEVNWRIDFDEDEAGEAKKAYAIPSVDIKRNESSTPVVYSMRNDGIPCIAATCGYCGFIRNHHLNIIEEWLKNNPDDSEKDQDNKA